MTPSDAPREDSDSRTEARRGDLALLDFRVGSLTLAAPETFPLKLEGLALDELDLEDPGTTTEPPILERLESVLLDLPEPF